MAFNPHIFDSELVQSTVRERIAQYYSYGIIAIGASLGLLYIASLPGVNTVVVLSVTSLLWLLGGRVVASNISELRNIVWCVKISERGVVGYDYARTRRAVDWEDIDRINLTEDGIQVLSVHAQPLQVPHMFADYHDISHMLMDESEYRGIPLFVNGYPWHQATVYQLIPELKQTALRQVS